MSTIPCPTVSMYPHLSIRMAAVSIIISPVQQTAEVSIISPVQQHSTELARSCGDLAMDLSA